MYSIRRQLTIQILVTTLMSLLVAGSIFLGVVHRRLIRDFDKTLETEAEELERNAERKGQMIVWDVPEEYSVGSREKLTPPDYCQMFLEDGTVVGLSQTLGVNNLPRAAEREHAVWNGPLPTGDHGRMVQKTFLPKFDETESQNSPDDPHEQIFTIPAKLDPTRVRLVLVVARSRERLDALLAWLYLAGGAAVVVLSGALAWLVRRAVSHGLRPIEDINAQIAAITPDSLATRLDVSSPPVEFAAVEATVNRLLERVEKAFERERRFSSDLAHELRTPIAELRAACEVGERWPDDVESTRAFFRDTRMIALQLEAIVTTLLALARCEEGQGSVKTRRIKLQSLVRACWQQAAVGAAEKQLEFRERIVNDLTVECDEDKLAIILRNLLENAVAHSEPGTSVECGSGATAEGIELRLVNTARDLDQSDLAHVFDRFWRKDAARTDRRHAGLGLSIARAMCEALGIQLRVDLRDGMLFEARILFPAH